MAKRKLFFILLIACFVMVSLAPVLAAENDHKGKVVKMSGLSTLYYVADDGKRYVFPNDKIYFSWFTDFSDVETLSQDDLQAMPLGGNVRYRPGVLLVKITTDPKVYAVTNNGVLRWVMTEALARALYGEDWNILIDDVPDSFFTNYTIGDPIDDESDYDADTETEDTQTIDGNRGLGKKLGHAKQASTQKCRAIPAIPADPKGTGEPATPAIPARVCKLAQQDDGSDEVDETAPTISDIVTEVSTSTASISWTTDEEATALFRYSLEHLATASSSEITEAELDTLGTEHEVELSGLTASTTYYYDITATDASDNASTTDESSFTTTEE